MISMICIDGWSYLKAKHVTKLSQILHFQVTKLNKNDCKIWQKFSPFSSGCNYYYYYHCYYYNEKYRPNLFRLLDTGPMFLVLGVFCGVNGSEDGRPNATFVACLDERAWFRRSLL